jgi:hypothetical protein
MKNYKKLMDAFHSGKKLVWNDPDPIPNSDYTITYIQEVDYVKGYPITIRYGTCSEAEVFIEEISILD